MDNFDHVFSTGVWSPPLFFRPGRQSGKIECQENEQLPGKGTLGELRLHECGESVKSLALMLSSA